ncbi:YusW family protein [Halobacillus sp. Marseille-Q1614]|uniref:YusW family protein n=1 Tax=Halobacillus sp. Marseille-Q1614 TaxID=2709134 RepID=UPI00156FD896|nr:YusW family protein [Halobacillus sp. Marseille-Q1614]
MKRSLAFLLIPLFFLAACNNDSNEEVSNPPENAPSENEEQVAGQTETGFNFTGFELDVEYPDDKLVDVEYENEKESMEAKYFDETQDMDLKSDEALDKLSPIFEDFTFDQNTLDKDVIAEVKKAFSINDDYEKFELEIEFEDGTDKEYK